MALETKPELRDSDVTSRNAMNPAFLFCQGKVTSVWVERSFQLRLFLRSCACSRGASPRVVSFDLDAACHEAFVMCADISSIWLLSISNNLEAFQLLVLSFKFVVLCSVGIAHNSVSSPYSCSSAFFIPESCFPTSIALYFTFETRTSSCLRCLSQLADTRVE
jgi:hypothetical protein